MMSLLRLLLINFQKGSKFICSSLEPFGPSQSVRMEAWCGTRKDKTRQDQTASHPLTQHAITVFQASLHVSTIFIRLPLQQLYYDHVDITMHLVVLSFLFLSGSSCGFISMASHETKTPPVTSLPGARASQPNQTRQAPGSKPCPALIYQRDGDDMDECEKADRLA